MRKLKNNELNRLNLEEFKNTSKTPLVIVLDNVRSAHNVGLFFVLQMRSLFLKFSSVA